MTSSLELLHFSSFIRERFVSYTTLLSRKRHFEAQLQPTVKVTGLCNALAAVEIWHK
jgi:hypothetical protein